MQLNKTKKKKHQGLQVKRASLENHSDAAFRSLRPYTKNMSLRLPAHLCHFVWLLKKKFINGAISAKKWDVTQLTMTSRNETGERYS